MTTAGLPSELYEKISNLLKNNPRSYHHNYKNISHKYRSKTLLNKGLSSYEEAISYAIGRLPATFEVFMYVLQELKKRSSATPVSYLDVGSGPGASYWAIKETYPEATCLEFLESNPFMYQLLKSLVEQTSHVELIKEDAFKFLPSKAYDLISFSYSLAEMPQSESILNKYWKATEKAFIIIEPGTPQGFQTILRARKFLISQGANIIAPCSHNYSCPLEHSQRDWCHFSIRLSRSEIHRITKKGKLSYEDEKFSYLIASKHPLPSSSDRILKKPLKSKGHIRFDLCTPLGLQKKVISKSDGKDYKLYKNKVWGDTI